LTQSELKGQDVIVKGYRLAPDCGESMSELEFKSCPIAGYNNLAHVLIAYNNHKSELQSFSTRYPNPTIAILDAVQVVQDTYDEYTKRRLERERDGI